MINRSLKNIFLNIFLTTSFLVLAAPTLATEQAWKLEKNQNGIQVFTANTPGSAVKSFRGIVTVDNSMDAIAAVISDIPSYPRWMHDCKSAKTLKRNGENELFNYIVTKMPWPVLNRDSIVHSVFTEDKVKKQMTVRFTSKPDFVKKVANTVRINKLQGHWQLTTLQDGKVKVIYQMSVDPGGNIPKWLVNSMGTEMPFNTLNSLRRIAKEDKYSKS